MTDERSSDIAPPNYQVRGGDKVHCNNHSAHKDSRPVFLIHSYHPQSKHDYRSVNSMRQRLHHGHIQHSIAEFQLELWRRRHDDWGRDPSTGIGTYDIGVFDWPRLLAELETRIRNFEAEGDMGSKERSRADKPIGAGCQINLTAT